MITKFAYLEKDHVAKVAEREIPDEPGEHEEGKENFHLVWQRDKELTKETQYEIKHFADCIINGTKPLTDGHSTLQGLRVIWKLYEAEKNNVVADLRGLGLN